MKVGILSMHRVINYGSFLQAFALKQLLLQNGANEVTFIDIKPGRNLEGFEVKSTKGRWARLINAIKHKKICSKIINYPHQKKVQKCIQNSFPILGIDEKQGTRYDLAVIGSDEVFNCCQRSPWGYTLQLYGDVPEAKRVVSYAGSFGHTQYEQLVERSIDREIGETMKHMAAISVRDDNSFDIVKRLTGIEPSIHLDPVLAYGYQKEIEQATLPQDKDYIVIYAYPGRINDDIEIKTICDFAKKHNKKLYSFTYYSWCDRTIVPSSPFEVLGWFKGADCVISDTFHGTIFSIITHRPFVTLVRPSNRNKLDSLLKVLCLSERGSYSSESIERVLETPIYYDDVEKAIHHHRKQTQDYLLNVLND